ncbi:hypothetical protein GWO13_08660 [Candidatus Bathyarchaeota archaeon]|nr:hypothetical protein [Candidatus Bathyarchaeota archaeon]
MDERRLKGLDRLGFASFGFFLILVGAIFLATPNFVDEIVNFFKDFELVEVYPNVFFPAPASDHPVFYTAVAQFCIAYGLFQIAILVLRLYFGDYLKRKAGTLSGAVFWLGAGFLLNVLSAGNIDWFAFLSWIFILVGLSLVVRSLVILLFGAFLRRY